MNFLKSAFLVCTLFLCLSAGQAHAKADTVALYTEAVMTGDIPALETLLAPNYWHINANGHIEDKEHFINTIKNKELVVDRLTFTNARTAMIGDSSARSQRSSPQVSANPRLTANIHFTGGVTPG